MNMVMGDATQYKARVFDLATALSLGLYIWLKF
jgi:hypothetical protein